jgi:hypothetical protein
LVAGCGNACCGLPVACYTFGLKKGSKGTIQEIRDFLVVVTVRNPRQLNGLSSRQRFLTGREGSDERSHDDWTKVEVDFSVAEKGSSK